MFQRVAPSMAVGLMLCAATAAYGDARVSYLLHCGGCHLPDGSGTPPVVPGLREELGRIVQIDGGRDYVVRVPGASQAPISDRELTDILNWILLEFNAQTLPDGYPLLSEQEVTSARQRVLADPLKYREDLWQRYDRENPGSLERGTTVYGQNRPGDAPTQVRRQQ